MQVKYSISGKIQGKHPSCIYYRRHREMVRIKRILLECTHTYETNLNTGIQRVVRNIVKESKQISKEIGVECQPVIIKYGRFLHADKIRSLHSLRSSIINLLKNVYHKLRPILRSLRCLHIFEKILFPVGGRFGLITIIDIVLDILISPVSLIVNFQFIVVPQRGDLLLMLDSSWVYPVWSAVKRAKDKGAKIGLVVYDLIPITHPQLFTPALVKRFSEWFDRAMDNVSFFIAISETTRDEISKHIESNKPFKNYVGRLEYFKLGSIIDNVHRNGEVREELRTVFEYRDKPKTYLVVGTIEPRKNHKYLLDAFDEIWQKGADPRLCIVGRIGWLSAKLLKRIRSHPQYMNRLFMFNDVSDTELDYCYIHAKALVLPSLAEGFGLPLVEALHYGSLALVSDIPIFREVGKDFCVYFDNSEPASLAKMVIDIEKGRKMPKVRRPEEYQLPDWKDSCRELLTKSIALYEKVSG
jgi:alpha-1,2-rhamnosyltransferase